MDIIQILGDTWSALNGSGGYMSLFLIATLFLVKEDSFGNKILAFYGIISFMLVLNPIIFFIWLRFGLHEEIYWKVFMVLPYITICSYCVVKMFFCQKAKKDKYIVSVALLIILLFANYLTKGENEAIYAKPNFEDRSEYYELLNVIDTNKSVTLLADDTMMEIARAHSEQFRFPYDVSAINGQNGLLQAEKNEVLLKLHDQMKNPQNLVGNITYTARAHGCNYLVLPLDADERWEMENGGYEVRCETKHYVLYYDTMLEE